MTFRDDRDALLARADALEREAERLRRENVSLRDAAEAQRAADAEHAEERAEVEKLAARGAARKASRPAKPAKPRPTGRFADLLDESLSPTWSKLTWAIGIVALPASVVAVGFGLGRILPAMPESLLGLLGLVFFVAYFAGYLFGLVKLSEWVVRVEARHERRRLAALPIALDVESYLKVMATAQGNKVLEVRVELADAHPASVRETIADAARGWRGVAGAGFVTDTLLVRSPEITTSFHAKKARWNSNVRVHRWFRRLARKVLIPIGRAYPIASVRVT